MNQIKKLNLIRRKTELGLLNTIERMCSLGSSMTSTLNKKEPKARFATSYKSLLNMAKKQLQDLEDQLEEIEQLLEQQQKEKRFQENQNGTS